MEGWEPVAELVTLGAGAVGSNGAGWLNLW